MANEVRRRNDNVFGTLSSTMNSTGTTINSAGLANLEAISSTEHAVIVIDPNRTAGAPEHVKVTAHTGSATSATIVRGQFGTSARAHSSTEDWVHAPIASNATSFASAANLQGDFVPMNGWQSWTPTWANFTIGAATVTAKYVRVGRTIHFTVEVTFAADTAVASGVSTFTLPVTAANVSDGFPIGYGLYNDANGNDWFAQVWTRDTKTTGRLVYVSASAVPTDITATAPFTWTTSDQIMVSGTYEAAS